jgi:hypothetical protein
MRHIWSIIIALLLLPAITPSIQAQCGLVVGDTVYVTSSANVAGSLRAAINCVNDPLNTIRFIHFNINNAGVITITPTGAAPLPAITKANVVIDARTQPGWFLGKIVISGSLAGNSHGLQLSASGVSVYGLFITGYTNTGSGAGISLLGNNSLVEQNALSGNRYGIQAPSPTGFTARNNVIGVHPATGGALGNALNGIEILTSFGGNFIITENTIAHNNNDGIFTASSLISALISGNSIYCNAGGGIERSGFTVPGFSISGAGPMLITGAGPNGAIVEVFTHDVTGCDPVNPPCQGKTFLGSTIVSGGTWSLAVAAGVLNLGDQVTATATIGGTNTSPFLQCATVVCSGFSINFPSTEDACGLTATGSATAEAAGPGPFSYAWSNGQNGATATNLVPNTYTVTATDGAGCTQSAAVTINSLPQPTANPQADSPLCAGSDLNLTANAGGGTPGYNYNWEGPGGFSSAEADPVLSGIAVSQGGMYSLTVTDQNGCEVRESVAVVVNDPPTFSLAGQDIACNGEATGSIALTLIQAPPPVGYAWSNGATSQNLNDLSAGDYTVTVTDGNSCQASQSIDLDEASPLIITTDGQDSSCGQANGSASAMAAGGTPGYSFAWNTGATTAAIGNLSAGIYTVTVTDQNNCSASAGVAVSDIGGPSLDADITDVSCNGGATGSITLMVSGGTPPLTYAWSNGATSQNLGNLAAGNYSVTVSDGNSCQASLSVNVDEAPALILTMDSQDADCGQADGSASAMAAGGTPEYAFAWNTGATTAAISNLSPGIYTVTVTDQNNCSASAGVDVSDIGGPSLDADVTDVSCNGGATGSITLMVSGGTPPYSYNWNNGATVSEIDNLTAGGYTVTVTDDNDCIAALNVTVDEPPPLDFADIQTSPPSSPGGNDGQISVNLSGGTPPYDYTWSGPASGGAQQAEPGTAVIDNLPAGTYSVSLSDDNGCSVSQAVTINEAGCDLAISEVQVIDQGCSGAPDGSISLTTEGGTPPFTFQWSSGAATGGGSGTVIGNLAAGDYSVTLSDQAGCTVTTTAAVDVQTAGGVLTFIQGEDELCQGEMLLLSTNALNNPGLQYYWITPGGDTISMAEPNFIIQSVQPADAGDYYVFVDDGVCLFDQTGPFSLSVLGLPTGQVILAGEDAVVCENSYLLNAAPVTGVNGSWTGPAGVNIQNPQQANTLVTNLPPGEHLFIWTVSTSVCGQIGADTLTLVVALGLNAQDDYFTLELANTEIFMDVLKNDGLPPNTPYTLRALSQPEFGELITLAHGFQYYEKDGLRGLVSFTYEVCYENADCPNACDTATVYIEVLNLPHLVEGFSPNGDGLNDLLEVLGYRAGGDVSMELTIANRWGDIVYYAEDYLKLTPWDGRFGGAGQALPEGTYYAMMVISVDGVSHRRTQAIYLIH